MTLNAPYLKLKIYFTESSIMKKRKSIPSRMLGDHRKNVEKATSGHRSWGDDGKKTSGMVTGKS